MPVVVVTASMDTVNAVWWLSVFSATICGSPRASHIAPDIGMQMSPFAYDAMKLTFSGVANSAAQMQSPSFSRSASSVTSTISPRLSASRHSSMLSNSSAISRSLRVQHSLAPSVRHDPG